MLKLQYISDIHIELLSKHDFSTIIENIIPEAEILILSGDIGNPYTEEYDIFLENMSKKFKKIFLITGNHEYYNNNKTIVETNNYINNLVYKYSNISFLDNNYEYYEGYYYVGSTLWSHITTQCYQINDIICIKNMDVNEYNKINNISVKKIKDIIEELPGNIIVITHHLPLYNLINDFYKRYKYRFLNEWVYCDLQNIIEKNKDKIKCWVYGHTHIPSEKKVWYRFYM